MITPTLKRGVIIGALVIFLLIIFLTLNPFSWNDAGNRTVVERTNGEQIVLKAPLKKLAIKNRS